MLNRFYAFMFAFMAVVGACSVSYAGIDFTDVAVDTADIFKVGAIVLGALGAIWGIRKVLGLMAGSGR